MHKKLGCFLAVKMGANAIVRFDIKSIQKQNGFKWVNGLEVSGFAIKREQIKVNVSKELFSVSHILVYSLSINV